MDLQQALARELIFNHPLDTAKVLEQLEPAEAWAALLELPMPARAAVIEGFSPTFAARVLMEAGDDALVIVRELPTEVTADIVPELPDERRRWLFTALPGLQAEEIEELVEYAEDTAGSVMSPEVVALKEDSTVAAALTRLRRLALVGRSVNYVYVVDDEDRLVGVLLMRDLVLTPPSTTLHAIMLHNVARAYTTDPLDQVADLLRERKLLALPVVDDGERLRGVVSATQLLTELQEEGFEDAQKMFGAGSDERASSPPLFSIRKRLPWLQVNLATAFLAAAVVGAFQGVIAEITVLAVFLPVVAGQGGNAGAQALAVMLRALALDEVGPRPALLVFKEAFVGLVNGLSTGVVAGAAAVLLTGNVALGLVIAVAMVLNLVIAGAVGAGIPLAMHRLGQDPAQSSNIILTTVTDVVGFGSFLGLAMLARPWLLA